MKYFGLNGTGISLKFACCNYITKLTWYEFFFLSSFQFDKLDREMF